MMVSAPTLNQRVLVYRQNLDRIRYVREDHAVDAVETFPMDLGSVRIQLPFAPVANDLFRY